VLFFGLFLLFFGLFFRCPPPENFSCRRPCEGAKTFYESFELIDFATSNKVISVISAQLEM